MKVLLVAPLRRKVALEITASRTRFVFDLATELLKLGHSVSLLGSADSHIPGVRIIPLLKHSLNDLPPFENAFYAETSFLVQMNMKIKELAPQFDVIHNNTYPEFMGLLTSNAYNTPIVTTIHAPATPELDTALSYFSNTCLVAPSLSQKNALLKTSISSIIPHGTDTSLYPYSETSDEYLLWIGRLGLAKNSQGEFIDGKGVRTAISVAKATGKKLLLCGNIEDPSFFERDVKPFLGEQIQWVGRLSKEQPLSKQEIAHLMQNAKALLITTRFAESFGLTAIEAMSCGTPIIGFRRGAIPEIVEDMIHGFTVANTGDGKIDEEHLVTAVSMLFALSQGEYTTMRKACRERIEKNYSLGVMAENYSNLYSSLVQK